MIASPPIGLNGARRPLSGEDEPMQTPQTRYARAGDIYIAYQAVGTT